ncbi:putative folate-biopterin transporter 7 [Dorcoceras hygrometricum]|uniref:Putative folate-biopterin transporter 7 n=1 Tax=Dorcoceras hygrometricum TaxID=472368 RepID=A0A2Z7D788_9LAMI|nr:putative folate-biopterin transporter 7 [Dorcoceras hygrometricum]
MLHAIINAMKCMRAIKDWIARPVYQLANHLSQPLYPHGVSTGEIIGTTHHSASHNVAFNQVINQSVNNSRYSQGTAQPIEASQPSPATAITVESPWNLNLYQYLSTLKRGLNLARNHLPKSAQHPKNALPDFSRNLRTPAASRSIPQVVLQSLMDSSTVRSSRQQSQLNTMSANKNDIAPDTNLLSTDITMRYHSETTTHNPSRYSNYLKCATTGFTERQRFYFKMPWNQISPKFEIPKSENYKFEVLNPHSFGWNCGSVQLDLIEHAGHLGLLDSNGTGETADEFFPTCDEDLSAPAAAVPMATLTSLLMHRYPSRSTSGESSTTKHRLLHASGPHLIPSSYDPNGVGKRVKVRHLSFRVSMTFRIRITVRHRICDSRFVLADDVHQWNSGLRCDVVFKKVQICFSVRFRSGVVSDLVAWDHYCGNCSSELSHYEPSGYLPPHELGNNGLSDCYASGTVIMVSQLVMEFMQLMPPRHRGRGRGQIPKESEGQKDEVRNLPIFPSHLSSSPSSQHNSLDAIGLDLVVISSRRSRVLVLRRAPVVRVAVAVLGLSFVASEEADTPRRSVQQFMVFATFVAVWTFCESVSVGEISARRSPTSRATVDCFHGIVRFRPQYGEK